jgi:hypothetical protein
MHEWNIWAYFVLQFLFLYTFPFIFPKLRTTGACCTTIDLLSIGWHQLSFPLLLSTPPFNLRLMDFHISLFVLIILSWFILVMTADSSLVTTTRPLSLIGGSSVVLHSVPVAPTNLEAVITSTRFITLAWEPPTSTNGPITGYSIFYQQDGSER